MYNTIKEYAKSMNKTDIEFLDYLIEENQQKLKLIKINSVIRYGVLFIILVLFFTGEYEYILIKVINIIALLLIALSYSVDKKIKQSTEVFLDNIYRQKLNYQNLEINKKER